MASSAKRRRTTTEPASRKRARTSRDLVFHQSASGRRRSSQQTLTQIDFVKSSPFEDDCRFRLPGGPNVQPPVQSVRKRPKQKDSTLTQIDFFDLRAGDELKPDESLPDFATIEQIPSELAGVPQVDGTTDMSPPISRGLKSKRSDRPRKSENDNSQDEYNPGKKRRPTPADTSTGPKRRRRSGKFASVAGREPVPSTSNGPPQPPLMMRDSTDFTEHLFPLPKRSRTNATEPRTPTKNTGSVPSSQTPESLKKHVSSKKAADRRPLSEIPVNSQRAVSKSLFRSPAPAKKSSSEHQQKHSPQSKICALKVPRKTRLPRPRDAEASQHDLWSLQATSSPHIEQNSLQSLEWQRIQFGSLHCPPAQAAPQKATETPVRPPVRGPYPARGALDSRVSLPDVSELCREATQPPKRRSSTRPQSGPPLTPVPPTKLQTTEHYGGILQKDAEEGSIGGRPPGNMIPELEQSSSDELSDIGSPVANDTQFVWALDMRVSSPVSDPQAKPAVPRPSTAFAKPANDSPKPRGLARASGPASPVNPSPVPAPRLVGTSPVPTVRRQTTTSTLLSLPSFSTTASSHKISEHVEITQAPLNDTVHKYKPSSSPVLPHPPIPTVKSFHPASIPHPSQISTQAPSTQGFFLPATRSVQGDPAPAIDSIVIKDSSSVPPRLSQRQYSAKEDLDLDADIRLVSDSENEDEVDLNPSTSKTSFMKSRTHKTQDTDRTQTPSPESRRHHPAEVNASGIEESPVIIKATTRAERDAQLEVVAIPSSSPLTTVANVRTRRQLTKARDSTMVDATDFIRHNASGPELPPASSPGSSSVNLYSPSPPRPLARKYRPIPGFDNDTQSDFTQNGHVTAAYIHRMREEGLLPKNYVPKPFKPKNWDKKTRPQQHEAGAKVRKTS